MQIDLPKCCSYAPDGEKGPYIYFVKDGNRVLLPGTYPFNQSNSEFWEKYAAVSYTHLTLPTIYSV